MKIHLAGTNTSIPS